VKVKAEAIVGFFYKLLLDLFGSAFDQNVIGLFAHKLSQERIMLFHGLLVVALRVAVEVVLASAGTESDLPEGQRHSP